MTFLTSFPGESNAPCFRKINTHLFDNCLFFPQLVILYQVPFIFLFVYLLIYTLITLFGGVRTFNMSSTLVRHFFIFIADVTFHLFIFKMYYYLLIFDYAGFSLLQRVFLVVASGNHAAVAAQEPLIAEVSLAAELRLQGARASVLVARGLRSCSSWAPEHRLSSCSTWSSCSTACGIFLDQGLTPCLLHWQADSLPLNHQGAPHFYMYNRVLFAVDLQKVIILQN